MLPVTVTGSAFDRKIVSVLPVPFCQVLVSLWFRAREPTNREAKFNWNSNQLPLRGTSVNGVLGFLLSRAPEVEG